MWSGTPRSILLPNGAGNVAIDYDVPGTVGYDLRAVSFALGTDGNAGSRVPVVSILTGTGAVLAAVSAQFTLAASKSCVYTFAPYLVPAGANDAAIINAALPRFPLTMGMRVRIAVGGGKVGDTLTSVALSVVQYDAPHDNLRDDAPPPGTAEA